MASGTIVDKETQECRPPSIPNRMWGGFYVVAESKEWRLFEVPLISLCALNKLSEYHTRSLFFFDVRTQQDNGLRSASEEQVLNFASVIAKQLTLE